MAKVIVGMTISLDGFVAGQNGNARRLYPDLAPLQHTAYMQDAIEQTGAVLRKCAFPRSCTGRCDRLDRYS